METIRNKSSNQASKLVCCRACLAIDCKLYNIHEYQLAEAFERISGSLVSKDSLPQHLCSYCSTLLLKCDSFHAKCLRAQRCLTPEILNHESTLDYICTIDRLSHQLLHSLTSTKVQIIDTEDHEETIKTETNIDIVDIHSIIQSDLNEFKSKKDEVKMVNKDNKVDVFIVNDVKEIRRRNNAIVKNKIKESDFEEDTEIDDVNDIEMVAKSPMKKKNRDKRKSIRTTIKKMKAELDVKSESKNGDLFVDIKPVEVKKRRKKKEEVTRKFRNPANDYMPVFDFETFERAYNVQVITLTKEEQLAEIEARKLSANYLSSPHRCEDCGKGFLAEPAFRNHRARHSPSAGAHACEVCAVRFSMRCRRQEHQDLHRLKFLCGECGFVSRNRHQARKHHDVHAGKTFECRHCGKTFNKSSTYLSHVRLAHPAMNVACDLCGETFVGHVGLRLHKTRMHSEDMKSQFKCSTCSAYFLSLDALNRHTDTAADGHAGRSCRRCGESCASEELLQAHVREAHPTDSHRCEECEQTFASAASYALHHRRKHLGQRRSAAGLRRAPRGPRSLVCELCGRLLPNATLLRYHQRTHQAVKPFACPACPKTFAAKHARDWHTRTHTGERPYQCPLCPLAFSLKGNLQRHHKAVHLGQRKSLPCEICGRVFTTGSTLRMHINTQHRGLPWPKRDRRARPKTDANNIVQ